MNRYGSDKPDIRFGCEIIDMTEFCHDIEFKVFQSIAENNGAIKCIVAPNGVDQLSRKKIDDLAEGVSYLGVKGMAWMHLKEEGVQSPIAKFFSPDTLDKMIKKADAKQGDTLLFIAHNTPNIVNESLGLIRLKIAQMFDLIQEGYHPLWVVDFPLFEKEKDSNDLTSIHHPFTAPRPEDIPLLDTDPLAVRSYGYDIVINGMEIGGGSIRIHDPQSPRNDLSLT